MHGDLVVSHKIEGQHEVQIFQKFKNSKPVFTVIYGLDVRGGLDYVEAAHRFGECVMHAAACNGNLCNG